MAWDPFGNGKTSIRGAAGIFFGSVSGNEWNTPSNYQPFAVRQQFNDVQSLTNPYGNLPGGVSPFPYSYDPKNPRFILPASIYGISQDFQWPYSYQFNFSIERQFAKDWSATIAYVGTLSHRLPFTVDTNYPVYTSTATTANVNSRRPIDTGLLSSIFSAKSIMNASYNGLQSTLEKRFGRHFGLKGYYTFSKTLTGAQLQNNTLLGGAQDYRNLAEEKGRSDFDRRHNTVTSLIWTADYFGGMSAVPRAILNGWQISAIATVRSGLPFTVTTGRDNNLDGNSNDRASLVGNPFLDPNRARSAVTGAWFNTAAFTQSSSGVDGTAGRNILDGPGFRGVDLGIFRNFKARERMNLQFRAEITNAFNLVSLNGPNTVQNSSLFGTIRSASDMRQVQLGIRLTF